MLCLACMPSFRAGVAVDRPYWPSSAQLPNKEVSEHFAHGLPHFTNTAGLPETFCLACMSSSRAGACLRNWEPQPQQLQELQGQQQQQQRQQQQQTGKHHAELRPRTPAVKREDPDPKHQQKQQHHRQQHNLKREEEGQHSQGKQQPSPMLQQQQQKQRQQSLAERALALDVQASELVGLPPGTLNAHITAYLTLKV
eukprot:1160602-Pelagomonas_calceolata.AAC.16